MGAEGRNDTFNKGYLSGNTLVRTDNTNFQIFHIRKERGNSFQQYLYCCNPEVMSKEAFSEHTIYVYEFENKDNNFYT
ncbi:hypothetical protein [Lacihabitans soyangensis]|uniref:hypothetical protein n=1 Tax=Lacihabitans soyangensis TaxID=869394 RepID=UPI0020CC04F4|nr:hypothetical protein [Lacihabitans soyangensis]